MCWGVRVRADKWRTMPPGTTLQSRNPQSAAAACRGAPRRRDRNTHPLLQWVNGKPGGNPSKPLIVRVVEVRTGHCRLAAPDHPGFPLCRAAYFFLAARPRPAGAARKEMPVRIAFC
jgi:hypothetical protein